MFVRKICSLIKHPEGQDTVNVAPVSEIPKRNVVLGHFIFIPYVFLHETHTSEPAFNHSGIEVPYKDVG